MRKRIGQPFDDYQPLPLPKEKPGRALRDEEKQKLFKVAASNPNWLACCCFARISANTSAGPKECMTLRLKDVDMERRVMYVQPEGAKNIHRIRPLPLNDEAFEAMQLALKRARSLGAVDPHHYVFPFMTAKNKTPDPRRHQTTFKTAWKKVITAAGLAPLRMYDLRHTAITDLLQNPEVSEKTVEDLAGHIDPRMKKRYSHIHIERLREAVAGLTKKRAPRSVKESQREESQQVGQGLIQLLSALVKTRQA